MNKSIKKDVKSNMAAFNSNFMLQKNNLSTETIFYNNWYCISVLQNASVYRCILLHTVFFV